MEASDYDTITNVLNMSSDVLVLRTSYDAGQAPALPELRRNKLEPTGTLRLTVSR